MTHEQRFLMVPDEVLYEGIPDFWCAYHHCVEIVPPGGITCGECWHSFVDDAHLEHEFATWDGHARLAAEIFACPVCLHDF